MSERVFNFSSGPAVLPLPVLQQAQAELLNFENCGMSVMEMSHRSKEFDAILERAENGVRKILQVPEEYTILFLQGGASLQFAMVPMNLYIPGKAVDVLHTGFWTLKAKQEIDLIAQSRLAGSTESCNFTRLPKSSEIQFSSDASYIHICSNNTIFGTQWTQFPESGTVPLIADMSSDICSRVFDIRHFGLIFAGAQKNIGPSGVALVIIRKDLAERASKKIPTMLQYRTHIKDNSRYNTPPTFGIYIISLVMKWIESQGGISSLEKLNNQKAQRLYDVIDQSNYFYCPVEKNDRSKMNIIFRIKGNNETLEDQFAKEANKAGLSGLKGHRSVGGLRASIYNAFPIEGVNCLIDFMKEFQRKNG